MAKKILVTSIPCWNQKSGSDTWSSLLGFLDPSDLANIYVDAGVPDSPVAGRYFRIDENDVIKSIFGKVRTGREVMRSQNPADDVKGNGNPQTIYTRTFNFAKRYLRTPMLWARELLWKLGKWNSPELRRFIEDFKPDVLLYSIESYPYFNRINEFIIDRYQPKKVIAYLWDDNFTYKQSPHSFISKIERYFLRKQVKRLINKSTQVLSISPKMKQECDNEFGISSELITKPIFNSGEFTPCETGSPIKILYTGKLIIGRYGTLKKIAEQIKEINRSGKKFILDIYTTTNLTDKQKEGLNIAGCSSLHPPVPKNEVLKLQRDADILLFAESLSDRNLTARLSFSTKLTDYFSSGKCIWAVGHQDLGPIDYIKEEDAGFVSSSDVAIKEVLDSIGKNPSLISEYARKGYQCGRRNHDSADIKDRLSRILS